jgi:4-hydroxy-tetrahydrodipicolinate synthase
MNAHSKLKLSGCWTAMVTPFSSDAERVDVECFKQQIRAQAEGGVTGIVPCGTTGEAPTLAAQEHEHVVATAVDTAKSFDMQVMAGAGSNSTASAVKLHKLVASLGADAALHVAPYYNSLIKRVFTSISCMSRTPPICPSFCIPYRAAVAWPLFRKQWSD